MDFQFPISNFEFSICILQFPFRVPGRPDAVLENGDISVLTALE